MLGSKIKNYRKSLKLSLRDFSTLCGLGRTTIFEIENDKSNPSMETLEKIAKALNISVSCLLDEKEIIDNTSINIGENIKKIRQAKKLSLQDLVLLSGVAKSTIHDVETSRVNPTTNTLEKLAKALEVPISEIWSQDPIDISNVIDKDLEALMLKIQTLSMKDKVLIETIVDRILNT